jgi:hypothetical protein
MKRLHKLRGLPLTEVFRVIQFKCTKAQRRLRQDFRVRFVRKLLPSAGQTRHSGLRNDLQFFSLEEWRDCGESLNQILSQEPSTSPERIVEVADEACDHVFDLLGSGPVRLGEAIDWHQDFKSGSKWEPTYFRRIKEVELEDASDIKVPWELSRCYHFVALGMAYRLTNDEKYSCEFVEQCLDWIEQNPPYHGVNWHCAMEVAIRAINWIWAYYLFREAVAFDATARGRVASSLAVHGEYIWNNLEFDKRVLGGRYVRHNGNHYVADLVGLIYLGLVLPGPQASRWLRWGLQELGQEMQVQVLADGAHWELSPSYHRLVLELIFPAVILCEENQVPVPQTLRRACEAMGEFTMHYLKPDGRCPLVRDADDGRICIVDFGDHRDHRHLLALAGVFFGRPDFLARAERISGEVVWMLGCSGVKKAKSMSTLPPRLHSKAFPDAGFYVLRDGQEVHVFVCCADVGMKGTYGGHAHSDCLSFELYCGGTTFITDCGTYIYSGDPAARNRFRSTASHNTARVDGLEMNRFVETELFGMQNDARPKVLEWRSEPECDYLRAEHSGYTRLKSPVVHERSFLLDRSAKTLRLEDRFEGSGQHLFELFFHFFPGVRVEQVGELTFRASAASSAILLKFSGGSGWSASLEPTWVSERYGRKAKACRLVLSSRQAAPTKLTTNIQFRDELTGLEEGATLQNRGRASAVE